MTRDGKELVTPTFQVVGGERGVWLSELKPTGYLRNSVAWWSGNITFTVTIRDENGGIATDEKTGKPLSYVWSQSFDYDSWENDGYPEGEDALAYWIDDGQWYFAGFPITVGGEDDPTFAPGQGLWVEAPVHSDDDLEADYTITFKSGVTL